MKNKIIRREKLSRIIMRLKKAGKKIVHTNGCYDLIHAGHIQTLQAAKKKGDILIVSINSDASIHKFKGNNRPIMTQHERAEFLAALECVDYVTIFDEDDILTTLSLLQPDLHVKGGTFLPERIAAEKNLLKSWGGRMVLLPKVKGHSTTDIIARILEKNKKSQ